MDPKFGGVLHLWGVLGPCGPQNSGVPRAPQNSGTSSLFLGCPGPTRTPKLGGPPHLWGARGLQRPRIRGYPFLRGVPCRNLGVPLLCGVSGYLEHPETQGSTWTPKFRGPPLLWGALGPQHPKTWGGVRVYPQTRGAPPSIACPGPVCAPKHGGPTRTPKFGVPLLYGVPRYLVCPKTRGSPSFLGCPRPICTPKLGGPLRSGVP